MDVSNLSVFGFSRNIKEKKGEQENRVKFWRDTSPLCPESRATLSVESLPSVSGLNPRRHIAIPFWVATAITSYGLKCTSTTMPLLLKLIQQVLRILRNM